MAAGDEFERRGETEAGRRPGDKDSATIHLLTLRLRRDAYAWAVSVEMTYRNLGRSGVRVSPLGLGTMPFGYTVDEATSFALMDAAIDAGINLFDTADVYGGPQAADMAKGYGIAEEVIGRWLQRTGRRDDIVLATKVYQPMGLGPNDRRLSAFHIRRACEASIRRLQTDHIDLYQMHHVDRTTPWDETWQAMEQLIRDGKITYVGSSNFAAWDIATAQAVATARHLVGLTAEQSLYNLAKRAVELEVVPALRHLGIGLVAYSPLHAGVLAGVRRDNVDARPGSGGRAARRPARPTAEGVRGTVRTGQCRTRSDGSRLGVAQPGRGSSDHRTHQRRRTAERPEFSRRSTRRRDPATTRRDLARTRRSTPGLLLVAGEHRRTAVSSGVVREAVMLRRSRSAGSARRLRGGGTLVFRRPAR